MKEKKNFVGVRRRSSCVEHTGSLLGPGLYPIRGDILGAFPEDKSVMHSPTHPAQAHRDKTSTSVRALT